MEQWVAPLRSWHFFPSHTNNDQKQFPSTAGHLEGSRRSPNINNNGLPIQKLWSLSFLCFNAIKFSHSRFRKYLYDFYSLCLCRHLNFRLYYYLSSISLLLLFSDNWLDTSSPLSPSFSFMHTCVHALTFTHRPEWLMFQKKKKYCFHEFPAQQVKIFLFSFHHPPLTLQHDLLGIILSALHRSF